MRCLVHYIEHGRAEGRQLSYWQLKVDNLALEIPTRQSSLPTRQSSLPAAATSSDSRLCILVHIYYPELWPELAAFVRNLQVVPADVFINVTDSQWTPKLHQELRELCPGAFVQLSPNRGRDVGGHLRLLDNVDIERYDAFALMHTKKSRHLPEATSTGWRQGLIAPFAGNPAVASECLKLFSEQANTGMRGERIQ
jgi:lipopolysaccharide biosynthesis protein